MFTGGKTTKFIIHRISNQPPNVKRINTLIIEQDGKTHYVWIKHFNRLLGSGNKKTNVLLRTLLNWIYTK